MGAGVLAGETAGLFELLVFTVFSCGLVKEFAEDTVELVTVEEGTFFLRRLG